MEEVNFRFVRANDAVYLRKEDVIQYVLEFAECEEKDVRDRLKQAARNINKVGRNTGCNMIRPEADEQLNQKIKKAYEDISKAKSEYYKSLEMDALNTILTASEFDSILEEQQKRALDKWNDSL